MRRKKK